MSALNFEKDGKYFKKKNGGFLQAGQRETRRFILI